MTSQLSDEKELDTKTKLKLEGLKFILTWQTILDGSYSLQKGIDSNLIIL